MSEGSRIEKMTIDVSGNTLEAVVTIDGIDFPVKGIDKVNQIKNRFCQTSGKSFGDLIKDKKIVVTDDVRKKYGYVDDDFVKQTIDKTDEGKKDETKATEGKKTPSKQKPKPASTKPKDKEPTKDEVDKMRDERRNKKKVRNIVIFSLVALIAIGEAYCLVRDALEGKTRNIPNDGNDDSIENQLAAGSMETTYGTTDQEALNNLINNQTTNNIGNDSYSTDYQNNQYNQPNYDYDYTSLGSANVFESMDAQVQRIIDYTHMDEYFYQQYDFAPMVISSEYDTMHEVSGVKSKIVEGSRTAKAGLDELMGYIYGGSDNIFGVPVMQYATMSPFSAFITLNSAEGILIRNPDYNYGSMNASQIASQLSNSYNEVLRVLYSEVYHK